MNLLFLFGRLIEEYVWLIWAGALLGDVVLSEGFAPGTRPHQFRWVWRVLHSLALATLAMKCGILQVFRVEGVTGYFAGVWPALVVGALVLYISIRLGQRLDLPPPPAASAGLHSTVALALPTISALLLLLAGANSLTGSVPLVADHGDILVFVVFLMTLVVVGSLSGSRARGPHVLVTAGLAVASLLLLLIFLVEPALQSPKRQPWGDPHDDPVFYALTGLVCFALLSIVGALTEQEHGAAQVHCMALGLKSRVRRALRVVLWCAMVGALVWLCLWIPWRMEGRKYIRVEFEGDGATVPPTPWDYSVRFVTYRYFEASWANPETSYPLVNYTYYDAPYLGRLMRPKALLRGDCTSVIVSVLGIAAFLAYLVIRR